MASDLSAAVTAIRDLSRGKQASRMDFVASMMATAREFTARLELLASRGEYERALTLLESALDHGVRPTVNNFETVIMALPHFSDAESALRAHRLFRRFGYDPSPTSLRVLLTVYGCEQHAAGLHMAVRDLERMAFPLTPSLMGKLMFAYLANGAVDKWVLASDVPCVSPFRRARHPSRPTTVTPAACAGALARTEFASADSTASGAHSHAASKPAQSWTCCRHSHPHPIPSCPPPTLGLCARALKVLDIVRSNGGDTVRMMADVCGLLRFVRWGGGAPGTVSSVTPLPPLPPPGTGAVDGRIRRLEGWFRRLLMYLLTSDAATPAEVAQWVASVAAKHHNGVLVSLLPEAVVHRKVATALRPELLLRIVRELSQSEAARAGVSGV